MSMSLESAVQHCAVTLKDRLFSNLQHLDISFYSANTSGDLMARLTGDLDMVRHFFAYVVHVSFEAVFQFVASFIFLLTINVPLTLLLMVCAPFIAFFSYKMFKNLRSMHVRNREAYSQLNSITKENIDGNRTVKAFVREEYESDKMKVGNDKVRDINIEINRKWLKFSLLIDFFSLSLSAIALVVGGYFCITKQITIGELSVFTGLLWAISGPLRLAAPIINDFQRVSASLDKIMPIYFATPNIYDKEDAKDIDSIKDSIVFENVSFSIGKTKIIKNINLEIKSGETLAIMGPTGSGKSTILSLLLRIYDVSEGSIKIDGIDIRDYKLDSLRRCFGVSAQDVFLFSNTIEGNIAFSDPEMSIEEIQKYASSSCADSFIRKTPEGYETIIGEMGVGLSGGQKQRISLARALAANASVLVLDDTTSAVDMETEKKIQDELSKINCTKIIIAQRITSVFKADKIMILEKGEISQIGNHNYLKNIDGYYKTVLDIQHPDRIAEEVVCNG